MAALNQWGNPWPVGHDRTNKARRRWCGAPMRERARLRREARTRAARTRRLHQRHRATIRRMYACKTCGGKGRILLAEEGVPSTGVTYRENECPECTTTNQRSDPCPITQAVSATRPSSD